MKKLVVLAMLLVAVAAWAQLTAGVTLDYMWANDFGPGKEFSDRPILELKFTYKADDFTSVYVELEEGPIGWTATGAVDPPTTGRAPMGSTDLLADAGFAMPIGGLDRAYFTTDVGKQLKLPVGVVAMYGFNEWNNKDGIKVTKSEWEDWLGERDIRTWGAQVEITPEGAPVTLRSNWAWNPGNGPNFPLFLIGAYGTVAPITYEATYFTNNQAFEDGWIEGGVKFAQDVAEGINVALAVNGEYDMLGTTYPILGDDVNWLAQVGAQVLYNNMASLGLAWRGYDGYASGNLQVQVWAMPIANVELFGIVGLGLNEDIYAETFDSLELTCRYTMGKVQWYLGLFWNNDGGMKIAKEWADFTIGGNETTAIYMRGRVAI
jgi:hypothetical protein